MKKVKRNILLNPGPATTTDTVKYAQVVPDICPREEEFGNLIEKIKKDLVKIAGGGNKYCTILFAGSGTAVMDAVINSVVPPDKKILIINNGAYGERLVKIAQTYKIKNIELSLDWGEEIELTAVKKILSGEYLPRKLGDRNIFRIVKKGKKVVTRCTKIFTA